MSYDAAQTSYYLMVLGSSLLGFLCLLYIVTLDRKQKEKELELKYRNPLPSKKIPKKEKNDEIIDTLNFMLQNNIISHQEYNQLIVKCLPYMEGK